MFMGPRNRFQGMNSASICSLAGRYDNPIPPRFLAPIDFLKIPVFEIIVHNRQAFCYVMVLSPRRTESKSECQESASGSCGSGGLRIRLCKSGSIPRDRHCNMTADWSGECVCRTRLAVFYQSLRQEIHRVCRLFLYCTDFTYSSPTFLIVRRLFLYSYCTDFSYSSPTFLIVHRLFLYCTDFSYRSQTFFYSEQTFLIVRRLFLYCTD
jgi:hypothetical protein